MDLIKNQTNLHQIPGEPGKFETQACLLERSQRSQRAGLCETTGLADQDPGLLGRHKKTIGWRTDIDGLPIVEQTGLDFNMKDGCIFCGLFMTTALGLLDQLVKKLAKNNLLFLFQQLKKAEAGGMPLELLFGS